MQKCHIVIRIMIGLVMKMSKVLRLRLGIGGSSKGGMRIWAWERIRGVSRR